MTPFTIIMVGLFFSSISGGLGIVIGYHLGWNRGLDRGLLEAQEIYEKTFYRVLQAKSQK